MSVNRRGAFTCVGWQVTLCDPMRQVTLRSCEMEWRLLYLYLTFKYKVLFHNSIDISRQCEIVCAFA